MLACQRHVESESWLLIDKPQLKVVQAVEDYRRQQFISIEKTISLSRVVLLFISQILVFR